MSRCSLKWLVVFVALLPPTLGAQSPQVPVSGNGVAKASVPSPAPFHASLPLASRLTTPPETVLQGFRRGDGPRPTLHELNDDERAKVAKVLQQLPSFTRRALTEHVRSISFIDGVVGNGTTMKEQDTTQDVFNIVFRASLLNESVCPTSLRAKSATAMLPQTRVCRSRSRRGRCPRFCTS
jgi:hypothetical protein